MLCLLGSYHNEVGQLQIISDIYAKDPEALNHFHFGIIDADWDIYSTTFFEADNQLLPLT